MSDERDPEATVLRPRATPRRGDVPSGAWDNVGAWAPQPPAGSEGQRASTRSARSADDRQRASTRSAGSANEVRFARAANEARSARATGEAGPRRTTTPERPTDRREAVPTVSRARLGVGVVVALTVLALVIPTLLSPSEQATGRAISVAHGPLPRRADAARLPASVGDLRRDASADSPTLPFGQVDRAQYADAQNGRRVIVLTQKADVRSLEDYDQRQGMQASRFGRVSCGRRNEALQCVMLLEGGTLSATTIAPAWQPEDLARLVRQAYAGLPQ